MKAMVRRVQRSRRKTDKYGATVKVLVSLCGFCRLLPKLNKHIHIAKYIHTAKLMKKTNLSLKEKSLRIQMQRQNVRIIYLNTAVNTAMCGITMKVKAV